MKVLVECSLSTHKQDLKCALLKICLHVSIMKQFTE